MAATPELGLAQVAHGGATSECGFLTRTRGEEVRSIHRQLQVVNPTDIHNDSVAYQHEEAPANSTSTG